MAVRQKELDRTLVRCINTKTNKVLSVMKYLTQNDTYMKRVNLIVADIQAPPVTKLSNAKKKEVVDIDTRIKALEKDPVKNEVAISDLKQLKENIVNGR